LNNYLINHNEKNEELDFLSCRKIGICKKNQIYKNEKINEEINFSRVHQWLSLQVCIFLFLHGIFRSEDPNPVCK